MTEDPNADCGREQELQDVLAAYYESVDEGNDSDRQILFDRHPKLAAELADFFAVQDELNHLARPFGAMVFQGPDFGNGGNRNQFHPTVLLFGEPHSNGSTVQENIAFGDYDLQGVIARGGMGIVFRARQRSLNRLVALKLIRDGARASADDARRLRNEAEAVAHLDHPHIVPIHEVGEVNGCSFFSMKLVEGGNLAERLNEYQSDQRAAARLMATAARAVHHAHERGILHRDLKPSNILIDGQGQPLVADFGLARRVEGDSELTQTGAVLGTPAYMAPEQATGRKGTVTKAADIHGLGALLYAILTGHAPFRGETPLETLQQVQEKVPEPPSAIRQSINRDLETICLKCLEKEPARRYGSALAVAEDLERWLTGRAILARPASHAERVWRLCRRHPRMSVMAAAVVALLIVSATGLVVAARARLTATRLGHEVRLHEHAERRRRYVRDVQHASHRWEENQPARARALLDRHRPSPGEEDSRGFAWYYFDRLCSIQPETLTAHEGDVYCAVFSPDGKSLATAGHDKVVRIWNLESRATRLILGGHTDEINCVSFSADGRAIATASDDQTVKLWDATSGQNRSTFAGHGDAVVAAVFTPDCRRVVSVARKGSLIVWDIETSHRRASFRIENGTVQSLAISPDGRFLAIGGDQAVILSMVDHREVTRLGRERSQVNCVAFSHNGKSLVTSGKDSAIKLWQTAGWHLKMTIPGPEKAPVESVAFSPDDQTLAAVDINGGIHFFEPISGAKGRIASGQSRLWSASFSPDGRSLATTSQDGKIELWDFERSRTCIPVTISRSSLTALAFSPDGEVIILADHSGRVHRHETRHGRLLDEKQFNSGKRTWRIAPSHDAKWLATDGESEAVTLWDLSSGLRMKDWPFNGSFLAGSHSAPSFSPNGKWLAQIDLDNAIVLWDLANGASKRLTRLELETAESKIPPGAFWQDPVFSPRGDCFTKRLPGPGGPCLWDLVTASSRISHGDGHRVSLSSEAFSPDGAILATGGVDGRIILWDVKSLNPLAVLYGHEGPVDCLAFSPDGRTLFSGGDDWLVHIWDLETQAELVTLRGHSGALRKMRLSRDGTILATGAQVADDKWEIFLWRVTPAESASNLP